MRSERGIALVAVLWFVVLLSLVAAAVLSTSRGVVRHAAASVDRARAEALADAGVAIALTTLLEPAHRQRLLTDGSVRAFGFGRDEVSISIQDEGGRIDLNEAEEPVLRGLFLSAGVAPDRARALADAIIDWRDEDQVPEPAGAEAEAYRAAGRPHGPANHRFRRVAELRAVLGMTRALYAKVAPALTVYSGSRHVDLSRAPAAVRAALAAAGLPVDPNSEQYRAWTGAGLADSQVAGRSGVGRREIALPDSTTDTYAIRAMARLADGTRFVRNAVVQLTVDPRWPYLVYRWAADDD